MARPQPQRLFRPFLLLALACLLPLSAAADARADDNGGHSLGGVRLVAFGSEEMAYIHLPGGAFVWPSVEVLGGQHPRIILDFPGIRGWDEAYLPTGGGAIISRIRTFLHTEEDRLRVVLDLAGPPEDYAMTLGYEPAGTGWDVTVSAIPLRR